MKTHTILITAILTLLVSGCTSPKKSATKDAPTNDEYVEYTPTGSHIPVRVRKSQIQPTDAQTQSDQDAFTKLQGLSSSRPPAAPNSGR